jgi:alcohol dehydrogenase/propanol-preferring alcohol dehydrogenase
LCNAPRGLGVQRDGGFADHVLVPHTRYLLAYDPLPQEQACTLACAGLTAYSALRKAAPLAADEPLLIIGAGGVGLSAIRLARKLYPTPPIVAEIDKSKWDLAREAGAGEVIDPADPAALKTLMGATQGGVAVAIDFVGAAATFAFGMGALRKGGRLVCVGLFGGGTQILPALVALKAISITGSYVGSLHEMHELMALTRSGALPPLPLSTQPLANATQVLADLKAGHVRGRTVLIP